MEIIEFNSEYFNAQDTLDCGQIFRYKPFNDGFLVVSGENACKVYTKGDKTCIESENAEYFKNFFDLERDYKKINDCLLNSKHQIVKISSNRAKGIRILNQRKEEMLFSFIISQNNMIPRIKAIIERTATALGDKKSFMGETYFTFPKVEDLARCDENFYKELGYGYRARYMVEVANAIANQKIDLNEIAKLPTKELKTELLKLKGVGGKVADCIALFGYHRTDSFPVDTWIEKLYYEDFNGNLKDRKKITEWFLTEFGENSGYAQQYLFYYKRSLERNDG